MHSALIPNTGYIFNFQDKGAFAPDGKVEIQLNQEQIDAHNEELAKLELAHLVEQESGILYLTLADSAHPHSSTSWQVSQWAGGYKQRISRMSSSFHNMAGKNGRTDVWFLGPDGKRWHGVNIGDNQICRVHRLKKQ